jgi:glycine cleavage system regulatory protein
MVLGHSFGGGVATKFVHGYPDSSRYLVLLNSVGGPRSLRRSASNTRTGCLDRARPLVDLLRPSAGRIATNARLQRGFVENVARHPLSVMETARLALTADLRAEMAELAQRKVPVLVLWSDHDEVVPLSAFDTFCTTFGIDGHVVRGGHSWLLADPHVFGEVLDNVIHLQRSEHGMRAATANAEQMRDLLRGTTVPARAAARMLEDASPLWIVSEAPAVLAADLALSHPRLGRDEVRAVAREMPSANTYRLTVVATDRPGLLADTAAALSEEGVSIVAASATTWSKQRLALHAVTVRSATEFDDARWVAIGARLRAMERAPTRPFPFVPSGRAHVTQSGEGDGRSVVRVTAPDQLGLLSAICRWFADHDLAIEAAAIETIDAEAKDVFVVHGRCDVRGLARHLSGDPATFTAVCTAFLNALAPSG